MYMSQAEAKFLAEFVANETKHLLERIEKLEAEQRQRQQKMAEQLADTRPLRQMNSKTGE